MNAPSAEPQPFATAPTDEGWGWRKIISLIVFALAVHLAFIFLFGTKKITAPRAATDVPVFRLADSASELVRLTDPTLFVLPHAEDFGDTAWSSSPIIESPSFQWTEAPSFLALNPANLGNAFNTFMQTNYFASPQLNFKPQPQLLAPTAVIESALPTVSTWQLTGDLARRRLLNPPTPPSPTVNDVIAPSRVQVLVDADGNVTSAVLLESSGYDAADQQALDLARGLQFVPADTLMFGEIIFNWHTVPTTAP